MPRPGVEYLARDTPSPRSAPTDTGVWFVTGLTEKGSVTDALTRITSMRKYEDVFGDRVSYGLVYDSLETFFKEGGSAAYVSRIVGPAAVKAFAYAYDIAGSLVADASLIVTAKSAGDWANSLNVEIVNTGGTSYVVIVSHDVDGVLETSGAFTTRAEAVTWSASSSYVDITLGTSTEVPRTQGPVSFTTGVDDRAAVTESHWTTALAQFPATLGPGQVSAPGRTTSAAQAALLAHAKERNRWALCDTADVTSTGKATVVSAGVAAKALANADHGELYGPWLKVGGLVANTTRSIPPSAVQAGLYARNDATNDPGQAAAGINGVSFTALDVNATFLASDYGDLNEANVNMFRAFPQYDGEVRSYGARALADKEDYPLKWQAGWGRLSMAIRARGEDIAEHYVFGQIDGRGDLLAEYAGELTGMLLGFYEDDALYGDSPADAFQVSVGPDVNPVTDLANGVIRAVCSVRMSPFAELVKLEIVRTSITETLV